MWYALPQFMVRTGTDRKFPELSTNDFTAVGHRVLKKSSQQAPSSIVINYRNSLSPKRRAPTSRPSRPWRLPSPALTSHLTVTPTSYDSPALYVTLGALTHVTRKGARTYRRALIRRDGDGRRDGGPRGAPPAPASAPGRFCIIFQGFILVNEKYLTFTVMDGH